MPVREASIEDAADIARIHVESWKTIYPGMLPDKVLLGLEFSRHEIRWWESILGRVNKRRWVYVAETEQDGVVGFASGGPVRERGLKADGEIYALYLLDDMQGQGVGRNLFDAISEKLRAECGPVIGLWVLRDNPSRFFYEAMGGQAVATRHEPVGREPVAQVGYLWNGAETPAQLRSV